MTDPERVVAAAKAGIVRAHELALPPGDPDVGLRHEFEGHIARLEATLAGETQARHKEASESRELRAAVARLVRSVKVIVPALIVFVVVFAVASILAFDRLDRIASENRQLSLENAATQRAAERAVKRTTVQARVVIRETCERQNRDRRRLRIIIARGEANIPRLVAEGTITQQQADRALRDSRQARRDLHDDRCATRAARIPIPSTSPRP